MNRILQVRNLTTATDFEIVGTYDALVPQSLIELYQSGLKDLPETVSSFFDIQTRQWTKVRRWAAAWKSCSHDADHGSKETRRQTIPRRRIPHA